MRFGFQSLFEGLIGISFFGTLFVASYWAFARSLRSATRAFAVPLLFIPLASDWIRWSLNLSFHYSFLFATILFLIATTIVQISSPAKQRFQIPGFRRWIRSFGCLIFLHVLIRSWFFTGSSPSPADDVFSGYKAHALLFAQGWFAPHPEIPELSFNYYYYAYSWPAGLASWFSISLWSAWWVTAVTLCVIGGMLVMEIALPRLKNNFQIALGSCLVTAGASLSFIVDIFLKMPPKEWGHTVQYLTPDNLYLRLPIQMQGYWGPFVPFCSGLLVVLIVLSIRSWKKNLHWAEHLFLVLCIAGLAGYCTFFLVGYLLIVLPSLLVVLLTRFRYSQWLNAIRAHLCWGLCACIASLPILLEFAERSRGIRHQAFVPLPLWLSQLPAHQTAKIGWVLLIILFLVPFYNPASFLFLKKTKARRSPFYQVGMILFFWGTLVCCFGVTDDFVPKFGFLIALSGLTPLLFLSFTKKTWTIMASIGILGPLLLILNCTRANIASSKMDPLWQVLDQQQAHEPILVYYDAPDIRSTVNAWTVFSPFFSRAEFLVPIDQMDDEGRNFLKNPALLKQLPDTLNRLKAASPNHTVFKLTSSAMTSPSVLYQNRSYSLTPMDPLP